MKSKEDDVADLAALARDQVDVLDDHHRPLSRFPQSTSYSATKGGRGGP